MKELNQFKLCHKQLNLFLCNEDVNIDWKNIDYQLIQFILPRNNTLSM